MFLIAQRRRYNSVAEEKKPKMLCSPENLEGVGKEGELIETNEGYVLESA